MSVTPWIDDDQIAEDPRLIGQVLPRGITLAGCVQMATDYCWRLSAQRYTTRSLVLRPHRLIAGCLCSDFCTCHGGTFYTFSEPVVSVSSVVLDGATLTAGVDYELWDNRTLVRLNPSVSSSIRSYWPCCQWLSRPAGEAGTWTVTATLGIVPPEGGKMAVHELAVNLVLHFVGKKCQLPARTRTVTSQGITLDIADTNYLAQGRTGIPIVDMWLVSENPRGSRGHSGIVSPDTVMSSART